MLAAILELMGAIGMLILIAVIVGLWALPYLIIAEALIIAWIVWFWHLRNKHRM